MSIWSTLTALIGDRAQAVGGLIERLTGMIAVDPERRRQLAFSVAMIGLSAKMAKADGVVTGDEVATFRRQFVVPEGEERNVARLFNLARQDIAGYRSYAGRIAALYTAGDAILEDIVEGLFEIATADGYVHEAELVYLEDVAGLLGIDGPGFERIKARHVVTGEGDPYRILGVDRSLGVDELKRAYRRLVAENHPDRVIARGVPPEFERLANDRLAAINVAWDRIARERGFR